MILSGPEIVAQHEAGRIHIDPFVPEHIGPNSYDVRLGDSLLTYGEPYFGNPDKIKAPPEVLDPKSKNQTYKVPIPTVGIVLHPGTLYLGYTVEAAGSDHYVPMLEGRSSLGRLGLKVHVTAGFGDVGFKRQWTLELEVTHALRIHAGMRVAQVYFMQFTGDRKLYEGKYAESSGAESSQAWRDFHHERP